MDHHLEAEAVCVDANEAMLAAARAALPADRARFVRGRLEDRLPDGPFDLVVSVLAVHHVARRAKPRLVAAIAERLEPGGRFILADIVRPRSRALGVTVGRLAGRNPTDLARAGGRRAVAAARPARRGRDHPDSLADQVRWLRCAGLVMAVPWQTDDAAVVNADRFPPLEAAAVPGS